MKIGMFAIFDVKTGAYMLPFFQVTRGQAMRSLADSMGDKDNPVGRHPEDYRLFQLAEFDDESGEIEPIIKACQFVCNASEYNAESRGFQAPLDIPVLNRKLEEVR